MIQETYGNVRRQEGMMTVADKKYLGAYQLQQRMTSLTLEETNKMQDMPREGYWLWLTRSTTELVNYNSKLDAGLLKR